MSRRDSLTSIKFRLPKDFQIFLHILKLQPIIVLDSFKPD